MFRHLSHRVIIKFRFCLNSVYFLIGFIISFLQLFCKKIHIYSCCNRCRNLSITASDSTLHVVFPLFFLYIFINLHTLYMFFHINNNAIYYYIITEWLYQFFCSKCIFPRYYALFRIPLHRFRVFLMHSF